MFCYNCGKVLHENASFCTYCGKEQTEANPNKEEPIVINTKKKQEHTKTEKTVVSETFQPPLLMCR